MNFFYGTYGFDILSIFLVLLSIIFNFSRYTYLLGALLLFVAVYRAFSKNIYKRKSELNKFLAIANKILGKFGMKLPATLPNFSLNNIPLLIQQFKSYLNYKKQYKIITCPQCSQKLRLPRGKGSLVVTCKKCKHEFKLKT